RCHFYLGMLLQNTDQFFDVLFFKTKTMHSCIEFNVNGSASTSQETQKMLQYLEAVNFRFQFVLQDGTETLLRWIHYHDRNSNVVPSKLHTFIGIGYTEVIYLMVLQEVCNLGASTSVGKSLHHHHDFC